MTDATPDIAAGWIARRRGHRIGQRRSVVLDVPGLDVPVVAATPEVSRATTGFSADPSQLSRNIARRMDVHIRLRGNDGRFQDIYPSDPHRLADLLAEIPADTSVHGVPREVARLLRDRQGQAHAIAILVEDGIASAERAAIREWASKGLPAAYRDEVRRVAERGDRDRLTGLIRAVNENRTAELIGSERQAAAAERGRNRLAVLTSEQRRVEMAVAALLRMPHLAEPAADGLRTVPPVPLPDRLAVFAADPMEILRWVARAMNCSIFVQRHGYLIVINSAGLVESFTELPEIEKARTERTP